MPTTGEGYIFQNLNFEGSSERLKVMAIWSALEIARVRYLTAKKLAESQTDSGSVLPFLPKNGMRAVYAVYVCTCQVTHIFFIQNNNMRLSQNVRFFSPSSTIV